MVEVVDGCRRYTSKALDGAPVLTAIHDASAYPVVRTVGKVGTPVVVRTVKGKMTSHLKFISQHEYNFTMTMSIYSVMR